MCRRFCDNPGCDYLYRYYRGGLGMPKRVSEEASALTAFVGAQPASAREPFLAVLRELAEAYHAFSTYSATHVRTMGLTPAQFDVIATLGNTNGLSLSEIARKTLITKGTLTGIIDRLEAKGLLFRRVPAADRRSFHAVLTPAGEALFAQVFPQHIEYLKRAFLPLETAELERTCSQLRRLRERFVER